MKKVGKIRLLDGRPADVYYRWEAESDATLYRLTIEARTRDEGAGLSRDDQLVLLELVGDAVDSPPCEGA